MRKNVFEILLEDLDEEVLERLPKWFRVLRTTYLFRKRTEKLMVNEKPKKR